MLHVVGTKNSVNVNDICVSEQQCKKVTICLCTSKSTIKVAICVCPSKCSFKSNDMCVLSRKCLNCFWFPLAGVILRWCHYGYYKYWLLLLLLLPVLLAFHPTAWAAVIEYVSRQVKGLLGAKSVAPDPLETDCCARAKVASKETIFEYLSKSRFKSHDLDVSKQT